MVAERLVEINSQGDQDNSRTHALGFDHAYFEKSHICSFEKHAHVPFRCWIFPIIADNGLATVQLRLHNELMIPAATQRTCTCTVALFGLATLASQRQFTSLHFSADLILSRWDLRRRISVRGLQVIGVLLWKP